MLEEGSADSVVTDCRCQFTALKEAGMDRCVGGAGIEKTEEEQDQDENRILGEIETRVITAGSLDPPNSTPYEATAVKTALSDF